MYSNVPTTAPKPVTNVRSVNCCHAASATPKSITFGTGLPWYSATSTFVGLISSSWSASRTTPRSMAVAWRSARTANFSQWPEGAAGYERHG
jgi:hypothetical protein